MERQSRADPQAPVTRASKRERGYRVVRRITALSLIVRSVSAGSEVI
jgi:hypothetical protein